MDKLELDLDDLEVDSFQTNPEQEDGQGTVQGNRELTVCTCRLTVKHCDSIRDCIWKSEAYTACCDDTEDYRCLTQDGCGFTDQQGCEPAA